MKFLGLIRKKQKDDDIYADGNRCLQIISGNWDVQNANRYEVFLKVLQESQKYEDPLHLLACAYACHYSKVAYRKEAIRYFEKYLENAVPADDKQFSLFQIYSDLGEDYEAEYDFQNAERCYKLSIQNQPDRYFSSLTGQYDMRPQEVKLGRLYLKISTQKAVDYWAHFMDCDEYKKGDPAKPGFRRHVDVEYKNALEKHQKGYVYRPRKK